MTESAQTLPLVVDLDGSLIKTDLLFETFIKLLYTKPWMMVFIPFWLARGKAFLKQKLYENTTLDVASLPWNKEVLDYLHLQHEQGRTLILCTGSWHQLAERVGELFPFFSKVYGTDLKGNLTGSTKAKLLKEVYGENQFCYLGNEAKDLKIWRYAKAAVVVSNTDSLEKSASQVCEVEKSFVQRSSRLPVVLKQMRVHQWVKNILIFVPLVTSHQTNDVYLFISAFLAFIAYSLCASSTYILNDLSDLESDRKHHKKQFRPMASGALSIPQGLMLSAVLMLASFVICTALPFWFFVSLCVYILITLSYSFKLKRMQTLDITVLAGLYTLRIISGAIAISLMPSFWLLAFSMFVFLCLAIVKRLSEIIKNREDNDKDHQLSGRGYYVGDFHVLLNLATASGMMSILVFAMYINSPEVISLYTSPYALWLICPLFAYWIIRVLIMASRGEIDEDPIVFAIRDRRSWIVGFLILIIIALSSADPIL